MPEAVVKRIGRMLFLGIAMGAAAAHAQPRDDGEALYQQAFAAESGGNARDAIRIYRRAARGGSGKAAKRLGDIFSCGVSGIPRDYGESVQWYDIAFRLGETVPTADNRDGRACPKSAQ